jgi:rod shape-determining protein MreC
MPFDTLERSPPPFFRQGPSAATRLVFYAALSLLLMALDVRWHVAQPLRRGIALAIEPATLVARLPVQLAGDIASHFASVQRTQAELEAQRRAVVALSLQASRAAALQRDNDELRALLQLQRNVPLRSLAAQVSAQVADPYSRKLLIDKGSLAGVAAGSPVMDRDGLLGQITDVRPFDAQLTLITDRDSTVPVEVVRNGLRGVLVGDAGSSPGGIELQWQAANADLRAGDVLVTSGLGGIYPSGLAVARISAVLRPRDSAFARVLCAPLAKVDGGHDVLVLSPLSALAAAPAHRPAPTHPPTPARRRAKR